MGAITLKADGSFDNTLRFLNKAKSFDLTAVLSRYGQRGVDALRSATPKDTGTTADSWTFEIEKTTGAYTIYWKNTNNQNGAPIAVLLQMGHGTGTGGYVQGRDYINPAMQPIFDQIADEAWKAVTAT